jgi:hypothetical protein
MYDANSARINIKLLVTIACTRTICQQQQNPNPPSLVNPPRNPIPTSVSLSTRAISPTATASIVIFFPNIVR